MSVLICLINHRNISTLVATKALHPQKIILFHSGSKEDFKDIDNMVLYYQNLYPDLVLEPMEMDYYHCDNLRQAISSIKQEEGEVMLDLSNGNPVAAMLLREIAVEFSLPIFVFSERDERAIIIKNGDCIPVEIEKVDLQVEDFVESGGGSVYAESTAVFESGPIKHLLKWQMAHHDQWMQINRILKTKSIMRTLDYELKSKIVSVSTHRLSKKDFKLILEYLILLHEYRIAKFKKTSKFEFTLEFREEGFKHYIMGYGFWLEAVTYFGMKHLEFLDDLKSGVAFFWDEEKNVNNEIDILAVYREKLVLVSCKDTSKYAEKELNELIVSAERLGGDSAIPIMVVTHWPDKQSLIERAREHGVHLIRYTGDLEQFIREFREIFSA